MVSQMSYKLDSRYTKTYTIYYFYTLFLRTIFLFHLANTHLILRITRELVNLKYKKMCDFYVATRMVLDWDLLHHVVKLTHHIPVSSISKLISCINCALEYLKRKRLMSNWGLLDHVLRQTHQLPVCNISKLIYNELSFHLFHFELVSLFP